MPEQSALIQPLWAFPRRFAAPVLTWLASPWVTLGSIAAIAAAAVASVSLGWGATWTLAAPLTVFTVNLAVAAATHPKLRGDPALLSFHLALAAFVLLAALGRMTYLKGQVEVTEGAMFDAAQAGIENGPWHVNRLGETRFFNEGMVIEYDAQRVRGETYNQVRWLDDGGRWRTTVIGDEYPLVINGYRFYTTGNKGFAPMFTWRAKGGAPVSGSVHLPGYPLHEARQETVWNPPAGPSVHIRLAFDEEILDPERPSVFRVPQRPRALVTAEGSRATLLPGETMTLASGELRFDTVSVWMGYSINYDPVKTWLLAALLAATVALAWRLASRWRAEPWMDTPKPEQSA